MEKNNKLFKLNRLYHYIFGEKFYKKLDFEWHKYAKRDQIIQEVIYRKSYNSYLEICCDQNQVFSKIKISKKIGVDPVSGGTIRDTSDNFFKKNNLKFDIMDDNFDLINFHLLIILKIQLSFPILQPQHDF